MFFHFNNPFIDEHDYTYNKQIEVSTLCQRIPRNNFDAKIILSKCRMITKTKSPIPTNINFEISRLVNQAKCWEAETKKLFKRIGILPEWKCIDLGCGPMGVLGPLSISAGPKGHIVGLDENPFCVKAARNYIKENQLSNVEIIKGDLYKNILKPQSFNLSHMRFVFTQIGCDAELLTKMITLTRPGGVIISQESDWSTWVCDPMQPSWEKVRITLTTLFNLNGGDINAGLRTVKMFNNANLDNIRYRKVKLMMPMGHPYRSGLVQFAMSMRERILAAHILSENEFNRTIQECNEIVNHPGITIYSYTVYQVWGWIRK